MTKSVTKIQDKGSLRRLSVVRSTDDPTKCGIVILNPDGSKIRGPKGDKGDAATVNVGSTTTGSPGTDANVENVGTENDAVLNFTIPRGDKGNIGETGNGIASVTSEKVGKVTTVTIAETNGDSYSFTVNDGIDGEGAGDVLGPNSSTDGDVVLFDGNTGKVIKDGGKKLSDLVQTSGDQSIGGQKTFTTSPLVPSKSTDAGNNPTYIATEAQVKKVKDAIPTVVDDLTSTSATSALSANQGKVLNDKIDSALALGRFLSLWNSATGMPISFPRNVPYTYNTGDWYMVEIVSTATPPVNLMPDGSVYNNVASVVQDTVNNVQQGDVYIYDGQSWLFQKNNEVEISFANITGNPMDNTLLANAFNGKQDVLIAGSNITIGSDGKTISATDTTYTAGANIQINGTTISATDTTYTAGANIQINGTEISATDTTYSDATSSNLGLVKLGSDTVQSVNAETVSGDVGRTYAIQNDSNGNMVVNVPWKKVPTVGGTEPVSPSQGDLWYDTTEDGLKVYDGSNWKGVGGGGGGVEPVTYAEYNSLPDTKLTDGVWRPIKF